MSNSTFMYSLGSRIACKLSYSPVESIPTGLMVLRDASNKIERKIELTSKNLDEWIDVTYEIRRIGQGVVEFHLIRTSGNGPWSATLHLFATLGERQDTTEDTEQSAGNHLHPRITFRRKP